MTVLALIHGREVLDLLFVAVVGLLILGAFVLQERREQKRRIARKEKLAQYKLDLLRGEREYRQAQRYFGTGVG